MQNTSGLTWKEVLDTFKMSKVWINYADGQPGSPADVK